MPRYLYKGKDKTGQVRSGALDAESYAEARRVLQAQGIEISMLNQSSGRLESIPAAPAAPPLPTLPPERETSGLKRLAIPAFLLVGVVGLGVWLAPRLGPSGVSGAKTELKPGEVTRTVSVRGQVELLGAPSGSNMAGLLRDARLTVIFPDVPAETTLYEQDLHFTGSGGYEAKVYFLSPNEPQEANVTVRLSGFQTSRQTNLAIKKSGEIYDLAVPTASMNARKGFVPKPGEEPGGSEEEDSSED